MIFYQLGIDEPGKARITKGIPELGIIGVGIPICIRLIMTGMCAILAAAASIETPWRYLPGA